MILLKSCLPASKILLILIIGALTRIGIAKWITLDKNHRLMLRKMQYKKPP